MLSIGEFSKICSVSTKTLRYYEEIGLIKPIHINDENGYRYYDISQLKTMLKINKLKAYDFSLEEISQIIVSTDKNFLCEMLKQKRMQLSLKHNLMASLIKMLDDDFNKIERGIDIMAHMDKIEVKLAETKPVNILFTRQVMAVSEFDKYFGSLFYKIGKGKYTCLAAPMAIYHDKEFNPESSDIEIAVPVKEQTKETRIMDGGLCASISFKGSYKELPTGYAKLAEWIEKNNYTIIAPPYEVYETDPAKVKPEDNITHIFFPIKKQ